MHRRGAGNLAPAAKVALLRELGAQVIRARGAPTRRRIRTPPTFARASRCDLQLHAYDLPDVVAGAGVIGLEIEEQAPGADPVLVAVGGGGLVAGIAAALPDRQVIGVEPVGIPTLNRALRAGEPVDVEIDSIAADALGARRLGDIAFDVARRTGIGSVLVSDDDIVTSRRFLWREFRIVVEWAGNRARRDPQWHLRSRERAARSRRGVRRQHRPREPLAPTPDKFGVRGDSRGRVVHRGPTCPQMRKSW